MSSSDWVLVHRIRWYVWLPLSIFGIVVNLFMGLLGLGGIVWGFGFLLGIIPQESLQGLQPTSAVQFYGILLVELAFAFFLAWVGLHSTGTDLLDIFTPALTFEGPLEQLTTESRSTKSGSYRVFVLSAGSKQWEIAHNDLSDRMSFQLRVKEGKQIRLTYRRGSDLVTQALVKTG